MGNSVPNNSNENDDSLNSRFKTRFDTYEPFLSLKFKKEIYCKCCVVTVSKDSNFKTINPFNQNFKLMYCQIPKLKEIEQFNNHCAPFYNWVDINCKLSIFDNLNFTKFVKSGNIWVLLNTHFINCIFTNENFRWEDIFEKKERIKKYIKIINVRYQEYQYLINKFFSRNVLNEISFINKQKKLINLNKINTRHKEKKKIRHQKK